MGKTNPLSQMGNVSLPPPELALELAAEELLLWLLDDVAVVGPAVVEPTVAAVLTALLLLPPTPSSFSE